MFRWLPRPLVMAATPRPKMSMLRCDRERVCPNSRRRCLLFAGCELALRCAAFLQWTTSERAARRSPHARFHLALRKRPPRRAPGPRVVQASARSSPVAMLAGTLSQAAIAVLSASRSKWARRSPSESSKVVWTHKRRDAGARSAGLREPSGALLLADARRLGRFVSRIEPSAVLACSPDNAIGPTALAASLCAVAAHPCCCEDAEQVLDCLEPDLCVHPYRVLGVG